MNRIDTVDRLSRRQTLKTAATFMILPDGLARGYAANEKLNMGIIGLAGMGGVDAETFAGLGENISALCDVDSTILDKRGAEYPGAKKYTNIAAAGISRKSPAVRGTYPPGARESSVKP